MVQWTGASAYALGTPHLPYMTAPLPVITTRRSDRRDRGYFAMVAVTNEVAHLSLESAPIDTSTHVLEIYVDGFEAPLVVLAEPLGAPGDAGFPLRLRPMDDAHEAALRLLLFGGPSAPPPTPSIEDYKPSPPEDKPAPSLPPPLSEGHASALGRKTNPPSLARRAPGTLSGKTIGEGRFALESLIGAGASGEVYRAVHSALRRSVAVKVLHPSLQLSPDYCARFYSEALAASRLDHKNVLRIIDYGQDPEGLLYIVMELLEGESLQDILDAQGALPAQRIVDLVSQACAGLAHAHDAGVIHRDIKPENIVIVKRRDDDGREGDLVKVCDFGIAHWTQASAPLQGADVADTVLKRPDPSQIVGTPVYMAPEQIRNEAVDARTDVYALGVVLYELATGRVPFAAANPMDIMTQHLLDPPERPTKVAKGVVPELEEVILQCLAKQPDKRPQDTRELRARLLELAPRNQLPGASGSHARVSLKAPALIAEDFLNTTEATLAKLGGIGERGRETAFAALGEAIQAAVSSKKIEIARELVAWVEGRLEGASPDEREHAEKSLRALRDPEVMRGLAGDYLDGKLGKNEDALALFRVAGPVAAHALVEGRRARSPALELRGRFVAGLRAVGNVGIPPMVSALEPLAPLKHRTDEALAEDILRGIPETRNDLAGETTVRFIRGDKPAIGIAAIQVTAALWGARALPKLVGVLDLSNADTLRIAAIETLQKLDAIDNVIVDRLAKIAFGTTDGDEDVKVAAATGLAHPTPEAKSRALALVQQRLSPKQGVVSSLLSALGPKKDELRVTVALARSLLALDRSGARLLLEKLATARPELRSQVDAVLAGR